MWISLDMGCVKTPCSAEPQGVFGALQALKRAERSACLHHENQVL